MRHLYEHLEGRYLCSASANLAGFTNTSVPKYDHVVVVMEENHSYGQILGPSVSPPTAFYFTEWADVLRMPTAPAQDTYLRSLSRNAAVFANAHGTTHPSQPNYLALFSGSTQGVASDATITGKFSAPSLGGQLINAGKTFIGYSESMPKQGYTGDDTGNYVRRHNPWVNFADVPASSNQPFSRFPGNFAKLPSLSFVIPNVVDDMHSGSIQEGDQWLSAHLSSYARWAHAHNSLLVVTWDEDNGTTVNHIPTLFFGAHVRPGRYSEPVNDYRVLSTLEASFGVTPIGNALGETPITDAFQ